LAWDGPTSPQHQKPLPSEMTRRLTFSTLQNMNCHPERSEIAQQSTAVEGFLYLDRVLATVAVPPPEREALGRDDSSTWNCHGARSEESALMTLQT
jgi:hypothetical protein